MPRKLKCIVFSIVICFCNILFVAQQNKIDSLKTLIKQDKEDTNKVIHLNFLGWELMSNHPDTSVILANQAAALSETLKWKRGLTNSFGNLGVFNALQDNYPEALDFFFKALSIDEELKDKNGIAKRIGNIGIIYKNQGNYPKALGYFFKSLKMDEELGNKNAIAKHLGNIGVVYKELGDYDKTLDYFFKALKLDEELGNKNGAARHLGNIGTVYSDRADYSKALETFFRALKMDEELGSKNGVARHLGNIAGVYMSQGDYAKGLDYYLKALKMVQELGIKQLEGYFLFNMGVLNIKTEKFSEAFNCLYKALIISNEIGAKNDVKSEYEKLSILYQKSNIRLPDSIGGKVLNAEQMLLRSLYYFKRYVAVRDTIFSRENQKQLIQKEMNYDFEKKEAATKAEQDKKDAIAKEELKQKEQQRNYFVIGFGLVGLLAIFIFRGYRQKQKANILITAQKRLVDEHQKEILDSFHYAKRIQSTLLPSEKYFEKNLKRLAKN